MLIKIRVDAFNKVNLANSINIKVDYEERSRSIDRMVETNQIVAFGAEDWDKLNLPQQVGRWYVATGEDRHVINIPKRTWNINELRAYVQTGDWESYGKRHHTEHGAIGISRPASNLAVAEWQGYYMQRTGPSTYSFKNTVFKSAMGGLIPLDKLEWNEGELVLYVQRNREVSMQTAAAIVDQMKQRMTRTGTGTYRFTELNVPTAYGTDTLIYPIKARVGIFVSLSGGDKNHPEKYTIPNKVEIFHSIPLEWSEDDEYNFMYEMLDSVILVWTSDAYNLGSMLGKEDSEKRWHRPDIDDIDDIVNDLDEEFKGNFNYGQLAVAEGEYPNFFSSEYFTKILRDSLARYYFKDSLKFEWILAGQLGDFYFDILEKYGIQMFYDGKIMKKIADLRRK